MSDFTFTVPVLPDQMLSSNAGNRSRRNPWAVAEAKGALKSATMEALMRLPEVPFFSRCIVAVTVWHSRKKPKVEQCPRCLEAALGDKSISSCLCYRPWDAGNIGGDVLKPILDGMKWMEVFSDDSADIVEEVRLRIGKVATVAEEHIEVCVLEVVE